MIVLIVLVLIAVGLLDGCVCFFMFLFFFKQKTAYEMRISDWSSDVCSSDLLIAADARARLIAPLLWQRFATRLHEVPADGEVFPLVEIGAHCRGSLFQVGRAHV